MTMTVLRRPAFRTFWIAQAISSVGDWLLVVALPYFVYERTGSGLATAFVFAAEVLPQIVVAPIAGVAVDRWDRRGVLLAGNLLAGGVTLALAVSSVPTGAVYVAIVLQSCITQVLAPARNATVPSLVPAEELPAANGLDFAGDSVTRLIGPALGGLLLSLYGIRIVLAVDAATFVVAAGLFAVALTRRTGGVAGGDQGPSAPDESVSLWAVARGMPRVVRRIFALFGSVMAVQGVVNVVIVIFVRDHLRGGAGVLGLLIAAQGVGGLIGAFVAPKVMVRWPGASSIAPALAFAGGILLLLGGAPRAEAAIVLMLCAGVPVTVALVAFQTTMHTEVAAGHLGRVFGLLAAAIGAATLVGTIVGGVAAERVHARVAIAASGICITLAALTLGGGLRAQRESPAGGSV